MQWVQTRKQVVVGTGFYHLEYAHRNGCDTLEKMMAERKVNSNIQISQRAIERVVQLCNEDYNRLFLPQLDALSKCYERHQTKERLWEDSKAKSDKRLQKRAIFLIIGAIILVSVIATAIVTPSVVINEKVENVKSTVEETIAEIDTLKRQMGISKEINNKTISATHHLLQKTDQLITTLQEFALTSSEIGWTSSKVQNNMEREFIALKHLTEHCYHGQLNPEIFVNLINDEKLSDQLYETKMHEIELLQVKEVGPSNFHIQFTAPMKDNNTRIYKIETFPHLVNISIPSSLEYAGPKYVMYNITANCTKGIDNIHELDETVNELCNEADYIDKRLQVWNSVGYNSKTMEAKSIITNKNAYIYCPGQNITIEGKVKKCPHFVFKIDNSVRYSLPNKLNLVSIYRSNGTSTIIPNKMIFFNRSIHDSDYEDQVSLIENINRLLVELDEAKQSKVERVYESIKSEINLRNALAASGIVTSLILLILGCVQSRPTPTSTPTPVPTTQSEVVNVYTEVIEGSSRGRLGNPIVERTTRNRDQSPNAPNESQLYANLPK